MTTSEKRLLLSKNVHARFKEFSTYEDARTFLQFTNDFPAVSSPRVFPQVGTINFPNPKHEDFVIANFYIENEFNEEFSRQVTINPRFLCTKCEQAPTYHLGTRINALHTAAKSNNLEAAKIILKTITQISFFESLYPKDEASVLNDRCRQLNESYLNTPDKMLLETPLHYAAKYNSIEVLKLLITHPLCNLEPRNHRELTPAQIAGSRDHGIDAAERRKKIVQLLEGVYILPIWRDMLCASSPLVGNFAEWKSFGNQLPKSFYGLLSDFPEDLLPGFNESELLPRFEMSSYAGPMTKKNSVELFGLLKQSIGRKMNSNFPCVTSGFTSEKSTSQPQRKQLVDMPLNSSADLVLPSRSGRTISLRAKADMQIRMNDYAKGLERVCRKYSKLLNVPWNEYWSFLETYCDLESHHGLQLLENFLRFRIRNVPEPKSITEDDCDQKLKMSPNKCVKRRKYDISGNGIVNVSDPVSPMNDRNDIDHISSSLYSCARIILSDTLPHIKEENNQECVKWTNYIDGKIPGENDRQAYIAIQNVAENNYELLSKYPAIFQWYQSIKAVGYFSNSTFAVVNVCSC